MFGFGKKDKDKSNKIERVYCDKLSNDKHSLYFTKVNGRIYVEDINLKQEKEKQLEEYRQMMISSAHTYYDENKEKQQEIRAGLAIDYKEQEYGLEL